MKFGVCGSPDLAKTAKEVGFDYFEWSVGGLLHPSEDEGVFETALAQARSVGLPCPVVNVFLPGDMKVTGPTIDRHGLETYISTALRRAETAGIETIVFGAGAARRIPEGFDPGYGWKQMVDLCRWIGPVARQHGVRIAIEPLNTGETNLINTAEEAARLVEEVDHPNIRMLVDGYHWAKDHNALAGILENGPRIIHAHVATAEGRRPPGPEDTCEAFFSALTQIGYDGRISFEGSLQQPEIELPQALAIMQALTSGRSAR